MTYEEFRQKVLDKLPDKFDSPELKNAVLSKTRVVKANDVVLDGIRIDTGLHVKPVVYLNDAYKAYTTGMSLDQVLDKIAKGVEHEILYQSATKDVLEDMNDYNKIKDKLFISVMNKNNNKDFLANAPTESHLNLFTVVKVLISADVNDSSFSATTIVREDLRKLWGVSKEQLFADAKENTPKILPPAILSLDGSVQEILGYQKLPNNDPLLHQPIFVLSNTTLKYGASSLLYKNLLSDLADRANDSFYVLPLSIHETMFLPQKLTDKSLTELNHTVKEINDRVVDPEERLSDTVYFFDKETKELSIATDAIDKNHEKSVTERSSKSKLDEIKRLGTKTSKSVAEKPLDKSKGER